MRARFLVLALSLGVLSACSPPTQLIVDVTRDDSVTSATYLVRGAAAMEMFGGDGMGGSITQWPATIAVRPEGNDATRSVQVEITGTPSVGAPFIVRRIVRGYVPGQITRIAMHVGPSCAESCTAGQSCEGGVCVSIPVVTPGLDGGVGDDAAPPPPSDAGVDAPTPIFSVENQIDIPRLLEFDITQGGDAVVLKTAPIAASGQLVTRYAALGATLNPGADVMLTSRVACAHIAASDTRTAWVALCGSSGFIDDGTPAGTPTALSPGVGDAADVVGADNFALLTADRVFARSSFDGSEAMIELGRDCRTESVWAPDSMLGVLSARTRGSCSLFVASSSASSVRTLHFSDERPSEPADVFASECFLGASGGTCACPAPAPVTPLSEGGAFGKDLALNAEGFAATTSEVGIRFPGSPNLRPVIATGVSSVAIGAYASGAAGNFILAYTDGSAAHVVVWGDNGAGRGQCAATPEELSIPGRFSRVRISDCVDGHLTLGLSTATEVSLRRLTCR